MEPQFAYDFVNLPEADKPYGTCEDCQNEEMIVRRFEGKTICLFCYRDALKKATS